MISKARETKNKVKQRNAKTKNQKKESSKQNFSRELKTSQCIRINERRRDLSTSLHGSTITNSTKSQQWISFKIEYVYEY